ncbi:MAG: TonB-dependent receptor [Elusimicrobiales bacterium]|nr:TonB-dependent receptor [Elusimicrobiales bacterium]
MRITALLLSSVLTLPALAAAASQLDDEFAFFREEAKFITASLRETSSHKAPASVAVVTAEDIKASGASTLWDALRLVPGVDVVGTRTGQGDVSIRGFNQSDSNRLLVLVDGRTVMQEFFGVALWEALPVAAAEIDRIEIVRGPASSLYGANALHGVINIITKTPEKLDGGSVSAAGGNREQRYGSAVFGRRYGRFSFKAGGDYRNMNGFEDGDAVASRAAKAHAHAAWETPGGARLSLNGDISRLNSQLGVYNQGLMRPLLNSGSLRADFVTGGLTARAFWNSNSGLARDFWGGPRMKYDTYDASVSQEMRLSGSDKLTAGVSGRSNSVEADIFDRGVRRQTLYAAFAENTWEPSEKWTVVAGARLDHHSLSGYAFSPRGSVMFFPDDANTLRFSAGTAFRNPTLVENYVVHAETLPGPATMTVRGGRDLEAEKMESLELAHNGSYGGLKTCLAVYTYRLTDLINTSVSALSASDFLALWDNTGTARAFGGEAAAEYALNGKARVFGNYSYFNASESGSHNDSHNSPHHKGNAGLAWRSSRFSGSVWAHMSGPTRWDDPPFLSSTPLLKRVPGYALLNAGLTWRAGGGLEASLRGFNLLDKRHYEILPYRSAGDVGQYGEILGARYVLEAAYKF